MFMDDFLSQMNYHISAQKHLWMKVGAPVKKAIINVFVYMIYGYGYS